MITYAPNIHFLFPNLPPGKRPQAVAEAGFKAFEFAFPRMADIRAIEVAQYEYGLQIVLFNMDVPDEGPSKLGYLADPNLRGDFRRMLDETLNFTRKLKTQKIMLLVGLELPDVGREAQHRCIVENLQYAAPRAADVNVLLTIETLNPKDAPGYFLTTSEEGLKIIREVNHPHVKFQFDTYHLQLLEGNLINKLNEYMGLIGHIQFGDVPGRSEPGTGEINFANLLCAAENAGYEGYIGLEFIPEGESAKSLAWVPEDRK